MKIELGKTYKTRDGRKARVVCVDRLGPHDTVVALVRGDAYENVICYTPEGVYDSMEACPEDLVEEWREPLNYWVLLNNDGHPFVFKNAKVDVENFLRRYPAYSGYRVVNLVEVSE